MSPVVPFIAPEPSPLLVEIWTTCGRTLATTAELPDAAAGRL
jgi:hypothetical protein